MLYNNPLKYTSCVLLALATIRMISSSAQAATLTYIDANLANTTASTTANSAVDSLWFYRTSGGWSGAGGNHMLATDASLNTSFITMDYSLAGLGAGKRADVYLLFGDNVNSDGISYSFDDVTYFTITPATAGVELVDTNGAGDLLMTPDGDDRYRYHVGQLISDAGTNEAILYIGLGNGSRTQFDGVAIAAAVPEPSTLLLASLGLVSLAMRRRRGDVGRIAAFAAVASLFVATPGQAAYFKNIYSEDFSGFATGPIDDPVTDFGWDNTIGDGVDVNGSGVVVGDGTDGGSTNSALFTLPSNTQSVTISLTMRSRTPSASFGNLASVRSSGDDEISFGASGGGYRMRRDDGSDFFSANIVGDDALTGGHQFFDHRLSYNFATDSGIWEVSRQAVSGGDGNFSTITAFTSANIGADLANPANWTGFTLRLSSASDQFDNISVTAGVIPEPSTLLLVGLGLVSLAMRRRRSIRQR